jgi:hypothetical protein
MKLKKKDITIKKVVLVGLFISNAVFVIMWIFSPMKNWEPWATLINSILIPIVMFNWREDTNLIELEERRLRLMVKPRIWSNGGGYRGLERIINVSVDNRGELCYVDNFVVISGDEIDLYKWEAAVTLPKDGSIRITGTIVSEKHPRDVEFRLRIFYRDQENNRYETVIDWRNATTRVIETIEL